MSAHDDLRVRLGRIGARGDARRAKTFVALVLHAAARSGNVNAGQSGIRRSPSRFGRGRVASWRAERLLSDRSRRVVIKARVVRQRGPKVAPLRTHLSYLRRDGVGRDGQRGQMFDPATDDADERAFAARCEGDRHHFRFTISPEDAAEMTDLRAFTRDLMEAAERDLGTRLDWVAVAHWNTDNPHVHIVLRGVADDRRDLVISRDYISRGLRARAAEMVTLELGPQSEIEVRHKLAREVEAECWTRLDAALARAAATAGDQLIDLRPEAEGAADMTLRTLLVGRMQRLERMGLARPVGPAQWMLADEAEPTLRELGLRGDIVKTMHRAFGREGRERSPENYALHPETPAQPIIGRLVEKGLADELQATLYLVIDGVDGRAHHVLVPSPVKVEDVPVGSIVELAPPETRVSDRTVAAMARSHGGIYVPARHVEQLAADRPAGDAEAIVEAHVRRLEALRRAGLVERQPNGDWRIPDDYLERIKRQPTRASRSPEIRVLSDWPIERQVAARGATWLDRDLVARDRTTLASAGFGAEVAQALDRRTEQLISEGLARRQNARILFARDLLATLRDRELSDAAAAIERETGHRHGGALADGDHVSGVYRRRVNLASGRYALVDDGKQFVLVPWRPVVEREIGREISGIVRAGGVSWTLGRARGPAV